MKRKETMKILISLLVIGTILITAGTVKAAPDSSPPAGSGQNVITLTAQNVTSAIDIESAVRTVTANGTRPGTLLLDGRYGPFVYSGDDRSINIFYSNLTFRGINEAFFPNTEDGFFFDFPADNIHIQDLFMVSKGGCISGGGNNSNVVVHGNTFQANSVAIGINLGRNWTITNNTILAGVYALQIVNGGSNLTVANNQLNAPTPIVMEGTEMSSIYNNTLNAKDQGIFMTSEASGNEVFNNNILGVQLSGISLQPGVSNNQVYRNKVLCAVDAKCQAVDAPAEGIEMNWISGNLP
jgi:hypothetical protein